MFGSFAFAVSAAALSDDSTGHSMFDWPDATHTSPTRMSATVMRLAPPEMANSYGPPAFIAGNTTRHAPVSSVVALLMCRFNVTETVVFGVAHPQMGMGVPRWSTS